MPVYRLPREPVFPLAEYAEPGGVLAVGGDLSPTRLIQAYRNGIFPWYSEGEPIWWHSPDPRFVLETERLHVPRTVRPVVNQGRFEIRFDTSFDAVIESCAQRKRPGQAGTWITRGMVRAYRELHRLGFAHCVEAWVDGTLVGGQYGVSLGDVWFGESMFYTEADASKATFVVLAQWLRNQGVQLIDCQVHTEHLERFGAEEWPRERYLARLRELVEKPTRSGRWTIEPGDPALRV